MDPLSHSFPTLSPYQFASNTPIVAIDYLGMQSFIPPTSQAPRVAPTYRNTALPWGGTIQTTTYTPSTTAVTSVVVYSGPGANPNPGTYQQTVPGNTAAANIAAMTQGINYWYVKKMTRVTEFSYKGKVVAQTRYNFVFENSTQQVEYQMAQKTYEDKLNAKLKEIPLPKALGPNANATDYANYNLAMSIYEIQRSIVQIQFEKENGKSPYQKIVDAFEQGVQSKEVKVEKTSAPKEIIYESPN